MHRWCRILPVVVIASLVFALAGCTVGSRRIIDDTIRLDAFDAVVFETIGDLTIREGERNELHIEGESNFVRRIQADVRDRTLYIRTRRAAFSWGVVPTRQVKFELTTNGTLEEIELTGVGSLYVPELRTDELYVLLSGAGKIEVRDLDADALRVEHTGVGQCEIAGEVGRQHVQLTGAGEYDAARLESEIADVTLTGVGSVTVWTTEILDIKITGAGNVSYYGDPNISQHVTGVGRVRHLGRR